MTRLRPVRARRLLTRGRSTRGHRRRRGSRGRHWLRHRGHGDYRGGSGHRRRWRLRVHHDGRRGERGREPPNDRRTRQVDRRIAGRRSGHERVRAVRDREQHLPDASAAAGPRAHHSRAMRGAHRARGPGCGGCRGTRRWSRRGDRGRAVQARLSYLREVGRRQRQRRNCGRQRLGLDLPANRVRDRDHVRDRQGDRAHEGEPEPHPAGSEAVDAERAGVVAAVSSGGGRNQPPTHLHIPTNDHCGVVPPRWAPPSTSSIALPRGPSGPSFKVPDRRVRSQARLG